MYLSIKDLSCLFLFRINHKNVKSPHKKKFNLLIPRRYYQFYKLTSIFGNSMFYIQFMGVKRLLSVNTFIDIFVTFQKH